LATGNITGAASIFDCAEERALARRAREFVLATVGARAVRLRDLHHGKYAGRVVARVETAAGVDLATALVAAGLARRYTGGTHGS
jgi:micrococcal nuclease